MCNTPNTVRGPVHGSILATLRARRIVQLRLLGPHRAGAATTRACSGRRTSSTSSAMSAATRGSPRRCWRDVPPAHRRWLESFTEQRGIPILTAPKGVRKEEVVASYYRSYRADAGVVVVLKSREQNSTFISYEPRLTPPSGDDFRLSRAPPSAFCISTSTCWTRSWGR